MDTRLWWHNLWENDSSLELKNEEDLARYKNGRKNLSMSSGAGAWGKKNWKWGCDNLLSKGGVGKNRFWARLETEFIPRSMKGLKQGRVGGYKVLLIFHEDHSILWSMNDGWENENWESSQK